MLGWRNCWRISASRSNRSRTLPLWANSRMTTFTAAARPRLLVGRPIDDAHRAGAQDRLDPERAQLFADQLLAGSCSRAHHPSLAPAAGGC